MNYIQIKNYRLFKDVELNLGITNFFVGNNNVGKTSLLKLIESIFQIRNIDLTGGRYSNEKNNTYLSLQNVYNLFFNLKKPMEVLNFNFLLEKLNEENIDREEEKNNFSFEYFKIINFNNIGTPVINQIIVSDIENKNVCKIDLDFYETFNNLKQKNPSYIKKISFNIYNFSDFYSIKLKSKKIELIKKIISNVKPRVTFEKIFEESEFLTDKKILDKILNEKLRKDKFLEYFFILEKNIKIDSLYDYYYYSIKKDSENESINMRRTCSY